MCNKIHFIFHIHADLPSVFRAISTQEGFDAWWSKEIHNHKNPDNRVLPLYFGEGYHWQFLMRTSPDQHTVELRALESDEDWKDSVIRFDLQPDSGGTKVTFRHTGLNPDNEHFQITTFCWAMYLRLLRRYVEYKEVVPYEDRLVV